MIIEAGFHGDDQIVSFFVVVSGAVCRCSSVASLQSDGIKQHLIRVKSRLEDERGDQPCLVSMTTLGGDNLKMQYQNCPIHIVLTSITNMIESCHDSD